MTVMILHSERQSGHICSIIIIIIVILKMSRVEEHPSRNNESKACFLRTALLLLLLLTEDYVAFLFREALEVSDIYGGESLNPSRAVMHAQ